MATADLRRAFECTLQADQSVRVQAEQFLEQFIQQDQVVFETVAGLLVQLQQELAQLVQQSAATDPGHNVDESVRAEIKTRMAVLASVTVFLKNRVAKIWKYNDDHPQRQSSDSKWMCNNLIQLVSKTFQFCRQLTYGDFSSVGFFIACSGSSAGGVLSNDSTPSNPDVLVANKDQLSGHVKTKRELRQCFLFLKQMQEMVKVIARKELPGALESVLSEAVLPILGAYAGQKRASIAGFDVNAPNIIEVCTSLMDKSAMAEEIQMTVQRDTNLSFLYGAIILVRASLKAQEYARMTKPEVMHGLIRLAFPLLEKLANQLLELLTRVEKFDSQAFSSCNIPEIGFWHDTFFELTRLVLKSYCHGTYKQVDEYCQKNIRPWMELTYKVINVNVPKGYRQVLQQKNETVSKSVDGSDRLLEISMPSKCLKWALKIAHRFFYEHSKKIVSTVSNLPSDEEKEEAAFAKHWKETYALEFTKCILLCLDRPYLPKRSQNLVLNILNEATEIGSCFKALKNEINMVLTKVCFPLISFSEEDLEIWSEDPHEFLKKEYSFDEVLTSPRIAAERFIKLVVKHRASSMLMPLLEFVLGILKNPPNPSSIDGALNILALLDTVLIKVEETEKSANKQTSGINVLEMIRNYVAPHLNSQYPFLRYRALKTYARYCHRGVFKQDFEDLRVGTKACLNILLNDSEWILKTHAAIEFQYFILPIAVNHTSPITSEGSKHAFPCIDLLEPVVKDVVISVVQRAQEFHCDELPVTLSVLSRHYPKLVFPFVGDLLQELVKTLINNVDEQDNDQTILACDSMFGTLTNLLQLLNKYDDGAEGAGGSTSGPSEFKQRAFADAGMALAPLFEKVFSNMELCEYHEPLGEIYALVTQNANPNFDDKLITLIIQGTYSNYVSHKFVEENGGKKFETNYNERGIEFVEATHVPLRNLLMRASRQVMRHPFQVSMFQQLYASGPVASGDENFQFASKARKEGDLISGGGKAHIMELVFDIIHVSMRRNELESRFGFNLIVPLFDNPYVRGAIKSFSNSLKDRGMSYSTLDLSSTIEDIATPFHPEEVAEGVPTPQFGLYCLQKLSSLLEITWQFLNAPASRKIMRKTYLAGILQLMTIYPEIVLDHFFARRGTLNTFLGNCFQSEDFFNSMLANKQRRKIFYCAGVVALRHFSQVTDPNIQSLFAQNLKVSIPDLLQSIAQLLQQIQASMDGQHIEGGKDNGSDSDQDDEDLDSDGEESAFMNGGGGADLLSSFFNVDEENDINAAAEFDSHVNSLLGGMMSCFRNDGEDEIGYSSGSYQKMAVQTSLEGVNEKEFLEVGLPADLRARLGL